MAEHMGPMDAHARAHPSRCATVIMFTPVIFVCIPSYCHSYCHIHSHSTHVHGVHKESPLTRMDPRIRRGFLRHCMLQLSDRRSMLHCYKYTFQRCWKFPRSDRLSPMHSIGEDCRVFGRRGCRRSRRRCQCPSGRTYRSLDGCPSTTEIVP